MKSKKHYSMNWEMATKYYINLKLKKFKRNKKAHNN